MIRKVTPNLMVENVNHAVEFFQEIMGFEMVMTVPAAGQYEWAMLKSGEGEIMLQSGGSLSEEIPSLKDYPIGGSFTLYMDVEGLYSKLKGKAEIVQQMHITLYGTKEFAARESNGYILAFSERAR